MSGNFVRYYEFLALTVYLASYIFSPKPLVQSRKTHTSPSHSPENYQWPLLLHPYSIRHAMYTPKAASPHPHVIIIKDFTLHPESFIPISLPPPNPTTISSHSLLIPNTTHPHHLSVSHRNLAPLTTHCVLRCSGTYVLMLWRWFGG